MTSKDLPLAMAMDENNKNSYNTGPLAQEEEEVLMEVDKVEVIKSEEIEKVVPEKDPREVYERKSKQFLKELYKYHENAGTPIVRHPKINGKEIDLYQLYTEMTNLGGWVRVNQRNDWDELLENINFPKSCVNAAVAIKYIYIRYLDRYEKLHFLGEEVERVDEDDEDVRQKKISTRYLHNVPMTYNHGQHFVSDANRLTHKLSTDFYKPTQNEKLFLSLLSPLPNEQNFAINVCMLISNEPVSTLVHLDKCPKIIDALLAHAGVYAHYSLREMFTEFYTNYRKHSLQKFWNECLFDKPHILELSFADISESLDGEIVSIDDKESEAEEHEVISSFLNLKRGSGTQDYIGLRVQQVATILRNLSFVEENSITFANNRNFLRFLVMCSSIRWNNLHHLALDMLGNVAEDIELGDPITDDLTRCLLSTIIDGLESEDRGVIISCLEVLYKLSRRSNNEDFLYKAFDRSLYRKITSFLWLKDAMLVMYTLECMYVMTNMGERTCNGFVHVRGIIDSLVSLVTLEAKTFGHEGCILMCVVDKLPGGTGWANQKTGTASTATVLAAPAAPPTGSPAKTQVVVKPSVVVQQSPAAGAQKVTAKAVQGSTTLPKMHLSVHKQINQENEQFVHLWLRTVCVTGDIGKDRLETNLLYNLYVKTMAIMERSGVVSPASFLKAVKFVYGTSVGLVKDKETPSYAGIKLYSKYVDLNMVAAAVTKATATVGATAPATTPPVAKPAAARVVTIPTNKPTFSMMPAQAAAGAPKPSTIIQQVTPDGTHVITTVAAAQAAAAAAKRPTGPTPPVAVMSQQQPQQSSPAVIQVTASSGAPAVVSVAPVITKAPSIVVVSTQGNVLPQQQPTMSSGGGAPVQSSLIKSLLANKVTSASVVVSPSPMKTVTATSATSALYIQQHPQTLQLHHQDAKKAPFLINPTTISTTNKPQLTGSPGKAAPAGPPAGAVAAASVIMSNVAAQSSGKATTASVPIATNTKLQSPVQNRSKSVIGMAPTNNNSPQLSLSPPSSSTTTNNPPTIIASNAMNVHQVAQRQQLQKQKELAQRNLQNTTIKQHGIITTVVSNNPSVDASQPPPLAPLSGGPSQKVAVLKLNPSAAAGQPATSILATQSVLVSHTAGEDIISMANQVDGMTPPFEDDEEDANSKQSKVTANKMLADLLEKKSDPPQFGEGTSGGGAGTTTTTATKRKMSSDSAASGAPNKRKSNDEPPNKVTPSAANLYAEMAASILEDEDSIEDDEDISMEEESPVAITSAPPTLSVKSQHGKTILIPAHVDATKTGPGGPGGQQQQQQVISLPLRQQIIMSSPAGGQHQQSQMILSGGHSMAGPGQATATIKTESGYQTVPILMQHSQATAQGGVVPVSVAGPSGTTSIIQRPGTTAVHAGQTQYVLATNPQGQTYVVATQSPMQPQMQTLLVTQTPQQQGTAQKTIIILQQQPSQATGGGSGQPTATPIQQAISNQGQKIIMTTSQGQQVMMASGGGGGGGVAGGSVGGGSHQLQSPQRQIVIQAQQPHQSASNIQIVQGGQVQKQILLAGGGTATATTVQPQTQQHYVPKAPMEAVENIPQHVIKTSTGLQIKPVIMAPTGQSVQQQQQQPPSQLQKAVITAVPQTNITTTTIQSGLSPAKYHLQQQPLTGATTTVIAGPSAGAIQTAITTSQATITMTPQQQQPTMAIIAPVTTASPSLGSPVRQASPKTTVGLATVSSMESIATVATQPAVVPCPSPAKVVPVNDNGVDIKWPYVCDWRGCPRKKFKSPEEVFYHACKAHCPDTLHMDAEIFCQWGPGPNLCDAKPRKRFSLMTHIQDRHCTEEKLQEAVQLRLTKGLTTSNLTRPITIIADVSKGEGEAAVAAKKEDEKKPSGKPWQPTAEAVSIIKRREFKDKEFTKEWADDNEGPVSISIRLTASLILRNLVTYSDMAKRLLKSHETHLSQIALSNVESSRTIAQVLYEMNDVHPV